VNVLIGFGRASVADGATLSMCVELDLQNAGFAQRVKDALVNPKA
jgi:hypothetical protein